MQTNELQLNVQNHTDIEQKLFSEYDYYFNNSPISTIGKLQNFTKYIRRQDLSRFLAKHELFKMQLDIPGSIIECGCFQGGGTMAFAQLSAIYEPYNHTRKIISFDTFSGFPNIAKEDQNDKREYRSGDLCVFDGMEDEITESVNLFDKNRPLSHISKVELIKGDATKTIPNYIEKNPHLIISMAYFDFDLYEPTLIGLQILTERMPKGSVLAFDELNTKVFPGETIALLETLGIKNVRLKKTIFDP